MEIFDYKEKNGNLWLQREKWKSSQNTWNLEVYLPSTSYTRKHIPKKVSLFRVFVTKKL